MALTLALRVKWADIPCLSASRPAPLPGDLEHSIAFQRRAHHVAAERRLAIVGPFQQTAQARGARTELLELGEIVLRVGDIEAS